MKQWLFNKIISSVFRGLSSNDVLHVVNAKTVYFKGRRMEQGQLEELKASAKLFAESPIWKFLYEDVEFAAQRKVVEKAGGWNDVLVGKAALWVVAVVRDKLAQLSKLQ